MYATAASNWVNREFSVRRVLGHIPSKFCADDDGKSVIICHEGRGVDRGWYVGFCVRGFDLSVGRS